MEWKQRFEELQRSFEEYKAQSEQIEANYEQITRDGQLQEETERKAHNQTREAFESYKKHAEQELSAYQEKLNSKDREARDLKVNQRRLEQENERLSNTKRQHEAMIADYQERIEQLTEEKVMIEQSVVDKDTEIERLRQDLSETKSDVTVLQRQIAASRMEGSAPFTAELSPAPSAAAGGEDDPQLADFKRSSPPKKNKKKMPQNLPVSLPGTPATFEAPTATTYSRSSTPDRVRLYRSKELRNGNGEEHKVLKPRPAQQNSQRHLSLPMDGSTHAYQQDDIELQVSQPATEQNKQEETPPKEVSAPDSPTKPSGQLGQGVVHPTSATTIGRWLVGSSPLEVIDDLLASRQSFIFSVVSYFIHLTLFVLILVGVGQQLVWPCAIIGLFFVFISIWNANATLCLKMFKNIDPCILLLEGIAFALLLGEAWFWDERLFVVIVNLLAFWAILFLDAAPLVFRRMAQTVMWLATGGLHVFIALGFHLGWFPRTNVRMLGGNVKWNLIQVLVERSITIAIFTVWYFCRSIFSGGQYYLLLKTPMHNDALDDEKFETASSCYCGGTT